MRRSAAVEIEIEIALPLLRLLELVGEDFLLTTKARDVGLDLLDVAKQIDERLVLDGRFEGVDAR